METLTAEQELAERKVIPLDLREFKGEGKKFSLERVLRDSDSYDGRYISFLSNWTFTIEGSAGEFNAIAEYGPSSPSRNSVVEVSITEPDDRCTLVVIGRIIEVRSNHEGNIYSFTVREGLY